MPHVNYPVRRRESRFLYKLIVIVVFILLIAVGWWVFGRYKSSSPHPVESSQPASVSEAGSEEATSAATLPNLQPLVDEWVNNHGGQYAITITDSNGKTLAHANGSEQFFTASLYKLFVAYVGYQKIDDGTYSLDEPYLSGYTRAQCLDEMIRSSYSPCAEKMWAELGKEAVTRKMEGYGLTNTSLTGLATSADDSAQLLALLEQSKDLKPQSRQAFKDSLKDQPVRYRRGLPAGFSNATVYNKVGWNENLEWHDAAIVECNNGTKFIVAVLTKSAGQTNVTAFGAALDKAVCQV